MIQRIKRALQKFASDPGDINRVILFLWFLTALGLLSLLFLATYKLLEQDWAGAIKAVGTGLFLAGAATVGGGLVGFLFGVPRHRPGPDAGKPPAYQPNTNLEQISDWLTKIIVGIGLTQFPRILEFIAGFGRFAGPAFGETPTGEIIAVCMLLHYLVSGFFQGFFDRLLVVAARLCPGGKGSGILHDFLQGGFFGGVTEGAHPVGGIDWGIVSIFRARILA